jgi:sulfofructosephosphate aldolase
MVPTLDLIARPGGTLAMVAMDQRESLRTMIAGTDGGSAVDDRALVDFKLAVARELGPLASGFLIDRHYAFDQVRAEQLLGPGTGLILAVDALSQEPGQPVAETDLDETVLAPDFDRTDVVALKLLIIWRRDERRAHRVGLARTFIEGARRLGLLSVLEPVVRATPAEEAAGSWDAEAAIREAARELSALGPSLYKVQVPRAGVGTPAELRAACAELDRAVSGPWVVLSQGVARENFLTAVTAACQSGASGFLAGRALWSDVVAAPNTGAALRSTSVPRMLRLIEAVDAYARPWPQA